VQCEEIPIDCSLVEATDEFVKAVVADATAATGEVGVFPDFTMVTCEQACKELEEHTSIPCVLLFLHTQLNRVERGEKFVKKKRQEARATKVTKAKEEGNQTGGIYSVLLGNP
jgi:hypothetical protein